MLVEISTAPKTNLPGRHPADDAKPACPSSELGVSKKAHHEVCHLAPADGEANDAIPGMAEFRSIEAQILSEQRRSGEMMQQLDEAIILDARWRQIVPDVPYVDSSGPQQLALIDSYVFVEDVHGVPSPLEPRPPFAVPLLRAARLRRSRAWSPSRPTAGRLYPNRAPPRLLPAPHLRRSASP